jgi:hypothetical protein
MSVRIRVLALFVLAAISMFAPAAVRSLLPSTYSPFWTPVWSWVSGLSPMIITVFWFLIFLRTYRLAGANRRRTLYLLLLVPFVLSYPAWMAIVVVCGSFFNWCGGPPL